MPASTTCRTYPYPLGGDPPTVADYFQALASAVDADVCTIAARVDDLEDYTPQGLQTDWTPTLEAITTDPNIGSTGLASGLYSRAGRIIYAQFVITFGGTGITQGSGPYFILLPVEGYAHSGSADITRGEATVYDASGSAVRELSIVAGTTSMNFRPKSPSFAAVNNIDNADIGLTFAAGDKVVGALTYLAAAGI